MFRYSCVAAILGFSLLCGAPAAHAQSSDPDIRFYEFARNKIGLLRFCRDQGLIGQISAERAMDAVRVGIRRVAVGDGPAKERGDRAEAVGESGFWEVDGTHYHNKVAQRLDTTPGDLCKELAGLPRPTPRSPAPAAAAQLEAPQPLAPAARSAQANAPAPAPAAPAPAAPPPAPPPQALSVAPKEPSPFEVNKWRFDRRERPWGWD